LNCRYEYCLFADKYLYFAAMGVAVVVAGAAHRAERFLEKRRRRSRAAKSILVARAVLALAGLAYILFLTTSFHNRQRDYSDSVRFWRQAVAGSDAPGGDVSVRFGQAYLHAGNMEEAGKQFGRAGRDGRSEAAQVEGLLWWSLTEIACDEPSWALALLEEAEIIFRSRMFLKPGNLPYFGLVTSAKVKLANAGMLDEAEFDLGRTLTLREWRVAPRLYIADIFYLRGFPHAAVDTLKEAHDIDPWEPDVLARLTFILRELCDPTYQAYQERWTRSLLSGFQTPEFLGLAQVQQYYDRLRAIHHHELRDAGALKTDQEGAGSPGFLSENGTWKRGQGAADADRSAK
jgi:tetratricopeptide (TPR) repeat protein